MEILAPVGTLENLRIAIAHGADAVYFSAGKFNARQKCQEINLKNLKECVEYAHLFNVKVYLTVNTLIKDDELNDLFQMLKIAVNAKVDAFIIQDLAVYEIIRTHFKNVTLHASTQMGIHNLDGAIFLEKLGFKRVVLARETSIEDIKQIRDNTNLEIEYFVQGALCVSFSGNCYLSSLMNNASGNRGECLQLCRLKYSAISNDNVLKNGYLLSTKDLCLINQLEQLKNAGVTSLKIEGRLRRGGYVAQAIDSYKKALCGNFDKNEEVYNLKKVFSRGDFNEGVYLYGKKDVINSKFQNHIGVEIGRVIKVEKFKNLYKIHIKTNGYDIKTGDGLKFINGDNQISVGVGNVILKNGIYQIFSTKKPIVNSQVNLTLDKQREFKLCEVKKKLLVTANVDIECNKPIQVSLTCNHTKIKYVGEVVERAKSSPITNSDVINCFNKLSDTEFEIEVIDVKVYNSFVAKSQLNNLRREAFRLLKLEIINNYNKNINAEIVFEDFDINRIKREFIDKNINYYIFNEDNQIDNLSYTNNVFIYSPKEYDIEKIKEKINRIPPNFVVYLNLPLIANSKDVEQIDKILNEVHFDGLMVNNYWGLKYSNKYKLLLSYQMNITNTLSRNLLTEYADDFIKSCEKQLVYDLKGGVDYSGKVALMTFAHCPQKTCFNKNCEKNCQYKTMFYKIENGNKFEIRRTKVYGCYFELLKNISSVENANRKCIDLR